MLKDDDPHESAEENRLYMRFRIRLTDVSAILVDGDYDWKRNFDDFHQAFKEDKRDTRRATFLPLLEKCGMLVALQQVSTFVLRDIGFTDGPEEDVLF